MTEVLRRQPPTIAASIFVVALCCGAAVLLFLAIPVVWAVLATIGLALGDIVLVRYIRGNRAM